MTPRPLSTGLRRWAVPTLVWAAITAGCLALLGRADAPAVIASTVAAATVLAGVYGHRLLARAVGKITAIAALSIISATLLGSVALLAPSCPDTDGPQRCTTREVAAWSLSGVFLPMTGALIIAPVLTTTGLLTKGVRRGAQAAHRRKNSKAPGRR